MYKQTPDPRHSGRVKVFELAILSDFKLVWFNCNISALSRPCSVNNTLNDVRVL